jgi:hypothetical protein
MLIIIFQLSHITLIHLNMIIKYSLILFPAWYIRVDLWLILGRHLAQRRKKSIRTYRWIVQRLLSYLVSPDCLRLSDFICISTDISDSLDEAISGFVRYSIYHYICHRESTRVIKILLFELCRQNCTLDIILINTCLYF